MSIPYTNAVWGCKELSGSELITMLALANFRNDKDGKCCPSTATLADTVRVTERQIIRILKQLELDGFIAITRGNGRGKLNQYDVNLSRLRQEKGDIQGQERVTPMSPFNGEKGDIQGQERVTFSALKGDIQGNCTIYKNHVEPIEESGGGTRENEPPPPPSIVDEKDFPKNKTAAHVIKLGNGEKLSFDLKIWEEMLDAMLAGMGWQGLAKAGKSWTTRKATGTLETVVSISPMFRNRAGIENLFACWTRARPNTPNPKAEWLEEFAENLALGRVRYPGGKNEKSGTDTAGNSRADGDGCIQGRAATFDFWQWKKDIANGKYADEPF